MPVVVVESPAKAKTINKYLGDDYTVLASFGHVRDLSTKEGSVDPDNDFEMTWQISSASSKHVSAIVDALKADQQLILATDPDREGEAISWHLIELLARKKAIRAETGIERVVFHSITKSAVSEAMKAPRKIDQHLVDAYLARRALDYLVGYNLSPILWRKLPGARSAGRVQSVALRLVVEREAEIDAFNAVEYWSVEAALKSERGDEFRARLVALDGKKLKKESLGNEALAKEAVAKVKSAPIRIISVETKPQSRNPSPPFMTSTLQQEASRKFGFSARQTMSTAQRLYEAGLITYMRTDGIDMAPEAVSAARAYIGGEFGKDYVPEKPRIYKNKAKNAQEAHECIRPTDLSHAPSAVKAREADQQRLYELIWKRTVASQMASARFERMSVELETQNGEAGLRANGQVMLFDGFLKLYVEGREGAEIVDKDDEGMLPLLREGEATSLDDVKAEQHFTQPPPRFSEASLIRRLEELGIGRPSTYASIISTILDREYVKKEQNRLIPHDKGKLVIMFLENYFPRYVAYDFTANLEEDLDRVSNGERAFRDLLAEFWRDFKATIDESADVRLGDVINKINELLGPDVFVDNNDGTNPRLCPKCSAGELSIRLAKNGEMFVGCGNYPECRFTRPIRPADGDEAAMLDGTLLGMDEGDEIVLRNGRFGPYVERSISAENGEKPQDKPPRASIPKSMNAANIDLAMALKLLSLPRPVGAHPDDGEMIEAGIGRYGPYVRHGRVYASLEEVEEVFNVGINRAVELIAQKSAKGGGRGAPKPERELGDHPEGGMIALYKGRYGPYVKWQKINASLPATLDEAAITLEDAIGLIDARAAKTGKGGKKKAKPASKKKSEKG